jgi:hypothetical protein
MFYGYLVTIIINIVCYHYYNNINTQLIKLKSINSDLKYQLETKISIIHDLNCQLDRTRTINNIFKLQLEQNKRNLSTDFIYLKK